MPSPLKSPQYNNRVKGVRMRIRLIWIGLAVFLAVMWSPGGAQTMPSITVANKASLLLEVIPLDQAHASRIPASLASVVPSLPPGSFLLFNHTTTPIAVVVAAWSYWDKSGIMQPRRISCDGFYLSPPDVQVAANDSALITPDGCVRQEYFAHMAAGKPMLGSPLQSVLNQNILAARDNTASVQISIDSVIFADGGIWGPDTLRYSPAILERYIARQSVVKEIDEANAAGESIDSRLESIRAEALSRKDKPSNMRASIARSLQLSTNREGNLRWLRNQAPPPQFHHIGEQ
jgi:hypothetical protein